jgi:hypothetical protein
VVTISDRIRSRSFWKIVRPSPAPCWLGDGPDHFCTLERERGASSAENVSAERVVGGAPDSERSSG